MIIDCHAHIGTGGALTASVDELLYSMDQARIDKAFVYAGSIAYATNEYVMQQVALHPDRLYAVAAYRRFSGPGTITDKSTHIQELVELYQQGKIVAVKFYTGYDHYYPEDVNSDLFELEQVGCPAIFHMGDCHKSVSHAKLKYAQPLGIDEVAVEHPKMNFVIAHMGNPFIRETAAVCYKNPNVYTDVSGFVYGKFTSYQRLKFHAALGEFEAFDKLLLGTDYPVSDQASYIDTLKFGSVDVQALSDNVMKAFGLNKADSTVQV